MLTFIYFNILNIIIIISKKKEWGGVGKEVFLLTVRIGFKELYLFLFTGGFHVHDDSFVCLLGYIFYG